VDERRRKQEEREDKKKMKGPQGKADATVRQTM
jgi:hypothetical protein